MKRLPHMKQGELRVVWGYRKGDGNDIFYIHGPGTSKSDSHLLHVVFACERANAFRMPGESKWDKSLIDELKDRGYDLTTLDFKIRKKRGLAPEGEK